MSNNIDVYLETATDFCTVIDYAGFFLDFPSISSKCVGWNKEDLLNIRFSDLIHPNDINSIIEKKQYAMKHNILKYSGLKNRFLCKDGNYKTFIWSWYYPSDSNKIVITGKEILNDSASHCIYCDKYNENQFSIDSFKNDFFDNLSHEFRTPLNIMLSSIQLITMVISKNEHEYNITSFKKHLTAINKNSYRLLKLINNLLEILKIDNNCSEVKYSSCNIVSLVEDKVLSVANYIGTDKRNIIFDTDIEELIICCDPKKIETILLKILSNAVKFTNINGNIKVTLSADYSNREVLISIFNDGKPIDEEYSKIIFDKFTQADELLNRGYEGCGLGLALVKSLVEQHNGRVWANTKLKAGAEIIFTIPIFECDSFMPKSFHNKIMDHNNENYSMEFSDIYNIGSDI